MFNLFKNKKLYSLHKSRHILKTSYSWYNKKGSQLTESGRKQLEANLIQLQQAILQEDRVEASRLAKEAETFSHLHFKKSIFEYTYELIFALILALIIATIVRQMWFELYEIPTGSMRPTFKEQDHLTVSKLAFGINVPLTVEHFYFDPNLVQRGSVLIFSGENMPVVDQDTNYFWVLPYKKRYIKRAIAKPGDTLYFYGGKLYAIDQAGNLITELLENKWMDGLEHIPFLNFEGFISAPQGTHILFRQMYKPVGKLTPTSTGLVGEIFDGKNWIKDNPTAQQTEHGSIKTYSDFFGMRNFAMARLLTKQQLELSQADISNFPPAVLYLELRHTPSLSYPKPFIKQDSRGLGISITAYTTIIPLQQEHLDLLMKNMYTARFVISNQRATRYSAEGQHIGPQSPSFPNVEDGKYEFYHGKAYKIGWGGISELLPDHHPLYNLTPANIQKLFNLGIEMDLAYAPRSINQTLFPQRYAYFREGELYLLGAPILKKDDPTLLVFHEQEKKKEELSSENKPYVAFKDYGPPLKADGTVDKEFIKTFGIKVPEKNYLVLGDNHAMSADSRIFGFVPEGNLQGAPSLIIWPPGDRLGAPVQKPYPIINLPRMIVWGIALLILGLWLLWRRHALKQPVILSKTT